MPAIIAQPIRTIQEDMFVHEIESAVCNSFHNMHPPPRCHSLTRNIGNREESESGKSHCLSGQIFQHAIK